MGFAGDRAVEDSGLTYEFRFSGFQRSTTSWGVGNGGANPVGLADPGGPPTILTAASKEAKHPTLINNGKGRILLEWVEGSGWNRGGSACWEVFDQDLQSTGERRRMEGVPPWGRVAGFASAAGDFVVLR